MANNLHRKGGGAQSAELLDIGAKKRFSLKRGSGDTIRSTGNGSGDYNFIEIKTQKRTGQRFSLIDVLGNL